MSKISFIAVVISMVACLPGLTQERHLLLKNGQVISGIIESIDQLYWVTKPNGSRLAFASERVDFVADDLSKIYWEKVSRLDTDDATGHIALFRWCLKKNLIEEAKNQLGLLPLIPVDHQQWVQMQNLLASRIETNRQQAIRAATRITSLPGASPIAKSNSNIDADDVDSATDANTISNDSLTKRQKQERYLQTAVSSLPPDSIVSFVQRIEPMMIRSCYTAGCHDSKSDVMPLVNERHSTANPPQKTPKNLFQILRHTNLNSPLESEILAAAALPHANLEQPIWKVDSQNFQSLRQWLIKISAQPHKKHALPNTFLKSDLLVNKTVENRIAKLSQRQQPTPDTPTADQKFSPIPKNEPSADSQTTDQKSKSADPFDPEEFNRKHLNRQASTRQ